MTDIWCGGHAPKTQSLPPVKWSIKKVKKKKGWNFIIILQLTSVSSSYSSCLFFTISISHTFAPGSIYLKDTAFVTYQSCQPPLSLGSEALGLRHKSSWGNFLIEQKPGDTKPRCEMHQRFLGLGGELWEQPADKTNSQIKPFRWSSLSRHTKVANIFASQAPTTPEHQMRLSWDSAGVPRARSSTGFCPGSGYHSQLLLSYLVSQLLF